MIAFDRVSVRRGGREVVSDVSFTLSAGEVTVLLGANGAGKSSVVRLLSGEWMPSEGAIVWGGRPLSDFSRERLARERAVVSQHGAAAFPLRVFDLVQLGRLPHAKRFGADDRRVVWEALEEVGVAAFASSSVETLSGGERQRVHLARALVQLHEARRARSGVLLLDEPTSHLDLAHQQNVLRIARRLAAGGMAVLAVLHDLNLAAAVADRVLLMKRGRLLAAGTANAVLSPSLLREALEVEIEAVGRAPGRMVFVPV